MTERSGDTAFDSHATMEMREPSAVPKRRGATLPAAVQNAFGTKFKPAAQGGPQGQPNVGQGEYSGRVSFYFGKLP